MKNIPILSRNDREELFIVTAREVNLPEAMVEKDFWVCWTLDYLFQAPRRILCKRISTNSRISRYQCA